MTLAELHRRLARELARVARTHAELADALDREAPAEPEPLAARSPEEIREVARARLRRAGIRSKRSA